MAEKWKLKLSGISLFHMKTRVCIIYFVNNCGTLLNKTSTNMIYTGYVLGGNKDINKIARTRWNHPVKLDMRRKVWYLFLRVF